MKKGEATKLLDWIQALRQKEEARQRLMNQQRANVIELAYERERMSTYKEGLAKGKPAESGTMIDTKDDMDFAPEYIDRHGKKMTMKDWATSLGSDDRIVLKTMVGKYMVSTVWLGLVHGYDEQNRPLIFETMVFDTSDGSLDSVGDDDSGEIQHRHADEEDAVDCHQRVVDEMRARR